MGRVGNLNFCFSPLSPLRPLVTLLFFSILFETFERRSDSSPRLFHAAEAEASLLCWAVVWSVSADECRAARMLVQPATAFAPELRNFARSGGVTPQAFS